jgi:hypothetical protein
MMPGKEIAVKKYVVRLSEDERNQLNEMIRKGKSSAQLLTKARNLIGQAHFSLIHGIGVHIPSEAV